MSPKWTGIVDRLMTWVGSAGKAAWAGAAGTAGGAARMEVLELREVLELLGCWSSWLDGPMIDWHCIDACNDTNK